MPLTLTAVDPERYVADAKRALVEFLAYYLTEDCAALFAPWSGLVDVSADHPAVPLYAADGSPRAFPRPALVVRMTNDEVATTYLSSAQALHDGEHHAMTFELEGMTDAATGGPITRDDLAASIQRIFSAHRADLEAAGFGALRRGPARQQDLMDEGRYSTTLDVMADVDVLGAARRTLELELARFAFTATGEGTFSAGVTLTLAQALTLKTLTGTGVKPIVVTVHGTNQDGDAATLTGTIPATRSLGTYVALTPGTGGDTFVDVTALTVSASSGLAGEAFAVVNIPQEL